MFQIATMSLMGIVRLLGRSRRRRRTRPAGDAGEDGAAEDRAEAFLEQLRVSLTLARLDAEREFVAELGKLVRSDHEVSLALLGGTQEEARSLSWLGSTSPVWSCLGLWEDPETRARLVVTGAYSRDGSPTPPSAACIRSRPSRPQRCCRPRPPAVPSW
ncbi:hypothetical protein ACMHYB_15810 [Sorangium sp. So ce1128]